MRVAIMQPYFFPYIGYFQLIHAVDSFVIYDDVNFMKGGWINRNCIQSQGKKCWFTLQLQGASPNVLINQVNVGGNQEKLLKSIQQSYSKATRYAEAYPVIEEILLQDETNLARFLDYGLRRLCEYLGLNRSWYVSSDLNKDNALRGQEKVLSICELLGASQYINLPGGKSLYQTDSFEMKGIQLSFIEPKAITYPQFGKGFVPNLSIIDCLMFNGKVGTQSLLNNYAIETGQ